jgi:futalosine hydrolase
MILLACAVAKELAFLAPRPHVEVLVTGVGLVEAASNVSRALAQSTYDLVVSAGIAGALGDAAAIGEGVVVSEEHLEVDLENGAPLALPDGLTVVDRCASSLDIVDRLAELGFAALRGVTVARVTAGEATAQRLMSAGAQIETMEGFAVLRAAEIAGVRAVEVRGISNRVGDRARSGWSFPAGVAGLEQIITALLPLVTNV